MTQLPKRIYVAAKNPDNLDEGLVATTDFTKLFDREFKDVQPVGVYDLISIQQAVLVPEKIELRELEGQG